MSFSENLRNELEYQGLTVKELAYIIGMKQSTIHSYMGGHKSMPGADIAVKIAKALNVTVEYLVTEKHASITEQECARCKKYKSVYEDLDVLPKEVLEPLKTSIKAFADAERKKKHLRENT